MTDMEEVLRAHGEWRYTNGAGSPITCRACGAPVENVTAHQAAALSAAGFGPVQEKPHRITQEILDAQRTKGWTDWHPEDYCHRCFETNVSWYVDTQPWTDVMRGGNPEGWGLWQEIICIPCFAALAGEHYGSVQAWMITRDRGSYALLRKASG